MPLWDIVLDCVQENSVDEWFGLDGLEGDHFWSQGQVTNLTLPDRLNEMVLLVPLA